MTLSPFPPITLGQIIALLIMGALVGAICTMAWLNIPLREVLHG